MSGRSCTVVLVGTHTADRKWINHEIIESWNNGMGLVGIRIHGLLNNGGYISDKGENPFDYITYNNQKFSSIFRCYDPVGSNSKERYAWISGNLANLVEEAIKIRDGI
jgi:hypothetical protein